MMSELLHLYRLMSGVEEHFNVEVAGSISDQEMSILTSVLQGSCRQTLRETPYYEDVPEIGPRMLFATPESSRTIDILHACGLNKVRRVEIFRYHVGVDSMPDRMLETCYHGPLLFFNEDVIPEPVQVIDLLGGGADLLRRVNKERGLGMDEADIIRTVMLSRNVLGRNQTDMEIFQGAQGNSEHSRHHLFNGWIWIDGQKKPQTLMQIIKEPLLNNPGNALSVFDDNAMVFQGHRVYLFQSEYPDQPSKLVSQETLWHVIAKVETHNHPTTISPHPGAATGSGGEIRDEGSTGKGSRPGVAGIGYCTANLCIPNFIQPWEDPQVLCPSKLASALQIIVEGSNGAAYYENCFGRPGVVGFWRTCDMPLPSGERRAWIKTVLSVGGIGNIDARHVKKADPQKGMVIIRMGGPAYNVGLGGGAASSMNLGENTEELDFASVQRPNPEMQRRADYVIRACVEMGDRNPIQSIHDQGAGGPGNVGTEIVNPVGGRYDISMINVGDRSMSLLEIWSAEYQEGYMVLVRPESLTLFQSLCRREKVPCEVLGVITGDGRIVVHNGDDNELLVDLPLDKILGSLPKKEFHFTRVARELKVPELPESLSVMEVLERMLRLPSVASKGWKTHKIDRAVTGLVGQQQCCGPLQQPVADCGIKADSYLGLTGSVIAIGENALRIMVDSRAGVRMCVGEAVTNLAGVLVDGGLPNVKCSGNWMWPAKEEGEGAELYDAVESVTMFTQQLGGAYIGSGKDSVTMGADDGAGTIIKAPNMLQITACAAISDITRTVTPDIKKRGKSQLWFFDIGEGNERLGGSALLQVYQQWGNESPDVKPLLLINVFDAMQQMIRDGLILAYHDRSDGGLMITLLEMAFAGNCGFVVENDGLFRHKIVSLFNEELGMVFEILPESEEKVRAIAEQFGVSHILHKLGRTLEAKSVMVVMNDEAVLNADMCNLRQMWHETTYHIERLQGNPDTARQEWNNMYDPREPSYCLTFEPKPTAPAILQAEKKPMVGILREQGCNSDREMGVAFNLAGFDAWDVTMTDLLEGRITLERFRGIVAVGGFSYGDTTDAGNGWAKVILLHPEMREMFDAFLDRDDTFSLGVCNGAQMFPYLGRLPWKGLPDDQQPRFVRNTSQKFESRWVSLKINPSPAIMLRGMEGSILGAHVDHGEGLLRLDEAILQQAMSEHLTPVVFVDDYGEPTERYPFNPNGSPYGITSLCSKDGRHLIMMPHTIDRAFLPWQWHWMPPEMKEKLTASPWLRMAQNTREWL